MFRRLPKGLLPSGQCRNQRFPYRCGGSSGFTPASQFSVLRPHPISVGHPSLKYANPTYDYDIVLRETDLIEIFGLLNPLRVFRKFRPDLLCERNLTQGAFCDTANPRGLAFYLTTKSACKAPAALRLLRMSIISLGETPRALRPDTT